MRGILSILGNASLHERRTNVSRHDIGIYLGVDRHLTDLTRLQVQIYRGYVDIGTLSGNDARYKWLVIS